MQKLIKTTKEHLASLPIIAFPFAEIPQAFFPERTLLRLGDGKLVQPHLWCYLKRTACKGYSEFEPDSLSTARAASLPYVLERASKWYLFTGARPRTIEADFRCVTQFLAWADSSENGQEFELILGDSDQMLRALKGHHALLRHMLQSNQITSLTASKRDQRTIKFFSEVFDRSFLDEIEPLTGKKGRSTKAPDEAETGRFMSTLQGIFDSAVRILLHENSTKPESNENRPIRASHDDDFVIALIPGKYSDARLMELACIAFAGLAIGDSGANLAQMQSYEEPEDLAEQLANPDRISLTKREIKLRAGGKEVPIHLTATILTRIRDYIKIRGRLVAILGCADIAPLFVQCKYDGANPWVTEPLEVRALSNHLLHSLRKKVKAVGIKLPLITFKQLRAFKQQAIARRHGVAASAEAMGHSMATAISAYCNTQETVRQAEMGRFLESLTSKILEPVALDATTDSVEATPTGACARHGHPVAEERVSIMNPDCGKAEGCFFCQQFRIHADETDLRKLLSCRYVLHRVVPIQRESGNSDNVYRAILGRVDTLLAALRIRMASSFERIENDVHTNGNLSRYWATKLQHLHLLGMLYTAP